MNSEIINLSIICLLSLFLAGIPEECSGAPLNNGLKQTN